MDRVQLFDEAHLAAKYSIGCGITAPEFEDDYADLDVTDKVLRFVENPVQTILTAHSTEPKAPSMGIFRNKAMNAAQWSGGMIRHRPGLPKSEENSQIACSFEQEIKNTSQGPHLAAICFTIRSRADGSGVLQLGNSSSIAERQPLLSRWVSVQPA